MIIVNTKNKKILSKEGRGSTGYETARSAEEHQIGCAPPGNETGESAAGALEEVHGPCGLWPPVAEQNGASPSQQLQRGEG